MMQDKLINHRQTPNTSSKILIYVLQKGICIKTQDMHNYDNNNSFNDNMMCF
jgi:hypothetical protein